MHAPSYKSFGSAPLALLFHQPGMSASTLHVLPRPPMAWTSRCCILNLKSPTDAFPVSTPAPTNNPNIAPAPLDVPSNLPFRSPVYANDVSWQFDVGIRGRYLDRSDLHATGIRALPSFEEVTPVRIVRIDRETEGTPLVAGIRGIDFEALSVVCRRRRADDDA